MRRVEARPAFFMRRHQPPSTRLWLPFLFGLDSCTVVAARFGEDTITLSITSEDEYRLSHEDEYRLSPEEDRVGA